MANVLDVILSGGQAPLPSIQSGATAAQALFSAQQMGDQVRYQRAMSEALPGAITPAGDVDFDMLSKAAARSGNMEGFMALQQAKVMRDERSAVAQEAARRSLPHAIRAAKAAPETKAYLARILHGAGIPISEDQMDSAMLGRLEEAFAPGVQLINGELLGDRPGSVYMRDPETGEFKPLVKSDVMSDLAFAQQAELRQLGRNSVNVSVGGQAGPQIYTHADLARKFPNNPALANLARIDPNGLVTIDSTGQPKAFDVGGYNENETKKIVFSEGMKGAQERLAQLEAATPDAASPGAVESFLGAVVGEGAANFVRTPQRQEYHAAANQWLESWLRDRSGAVLTQYEIKNGFETYFPRISDSVKVRNAKIEMRKEQTEAVIKGSPRAVRREMLEKHRSRLAAIAAAAPPAPQGQAPQGQAPQAPPGQAPQGQAPQAPPGQAPQPPAAPSPMSQLPPGTRVVSP